MKISNFILLLLTLVACFAYFFRLDYRIQDNADRSKVSADILQEKAPEDVFRKIEEMDEKLASQSSLFAELSAHTLKQLYLLTTEFDTLQAFAEAGQAFVKVRLSDHMIVGWRGAAHNIWGYTEEEALSMTVEELMFPEEREKHYELFNRAKLEKGTYSHDIECHDAQHKEGQRLHLSLRVAKPAGAGYVWAMVGRYQPPRSLRNEQLNP